MKSYLIVSGIITLFVAISAIYAPMFASLYQIMGAKMPSVTTGLVSLGLHSSTVFALLGAFTLAVGLLSKPSLAKVE